MPMSSGRACQPDPLDQLGETSLQVDDGPPGGGGSARRARRRRRGRARRAWPLSAATTASCSSLRKSAASTTKMSATGLPPRPRRSRRCPGRPCPGGRPAARRRWSCPRRAGREDDGRAAGLFPRAGGRSAGHRSPDHQGLEVGVVVGGGLLDGVAAELLDAASASTSATMASATTPGRGHRGTSLRWLMRAAGRCARPRWPGPGARWRSASWPPGPGPARRWSCRPRCRPPGW